MLAFLKRRQITFALVLSLALLLLVSFFVLGRNRRNETVSASTPPSTSSSTLPGAASASHSVSLDSDKDGLPDSAEMQSFMDRENFRQWFTLIAEGQFYHLSEPWNSDQRDCAGLVRFAWREALRRHDRPWFQKMGPAYQAIAPDVKRYQLEQGPLGEKLFRTTFGSYKDGDLSNGNFSEFADARSLKSFNTKFISRDRQHAQAGDLLFFYQPWVQKFPFHVMVFLGDSKLSPEHDIDYVAANT